MLHVIVTDEKVGQIIVIQVSYHHAQAVTEGVANDASFGGNVSEVETFIPIQPIPHVGVAGGFEVSGFFALITTKAMIHHEQVEITVGIIVEKGGLCGVPRIRNTVFFGPFGEGWRLARCAAVVDKELILTLIGG